MLAVTLDPDKANVLYTLDINPLISAPPPPPAISSGVNCTFGSVFKSSVQEPINNRITPSPIILNLIFFIVLFL